MAPGLHTWWMMMRIEDLRRNGHRYRKVAAVSKRVAGRAMGGRDLPARPQRQEDHASWWKRRADKANDTCAHLPERRADAGTSSPASKHCCCWSAVAPIDDQAGWRWRSTTDYWSRRVRAGGGRWRSGAPGAILACTSDALDLGLERLGGSVGLPRDRHRRGSPRHRSPLVSHRYGCGGTRNQR